MRGFDQIVKRQFNRVCDLGCWWCVGRSGMNCSPLRRDNGLYGKMEGGEGRELLGGMESEPLIFGRRWDFVDRR